MVRPDFNTVLDFWRVMRTIMWHLQCQLISQKEKTSPDPLSLSKRIWCFHCNGNIHRHTTRFDFCFLTEVSCHILSSLLQGNSSLVDTWERCYAKLHRRKRNKHRVGLVGPKWPVGELETLDFSSWRPSQTIDDLGRMLRMEEKWHEIYHRKFVRIAMPIF